MFPLAHPLYGWPGIQKKHLLWICISVDNFKWNCFRNVDVTGLGAGMQNKNIQFLSSHINKESCLDTKSVYRRVVYYEKLMDGISRTHSRLFILFAFALNSSHQINTKDEYSKNWFSITLSCKLAVMESFLRTLRRTKCFLVINCKSIVFSLV